MNKTKIEWTDYTWNPITGCMRDCWYCYVKRIKFYDRVPTVHLSRLDQPKKVKKHSKIFVCSTGDLFGEWISDKWITNVLDVIKECPQHTFQFLTKNPIRYKSFKFPSNCWLGATITREIDIQRLIDLNILSAKTFISFEPLLSSLFKMHDSLMSINWVIIGAMTGPKSKKYQPKIEWIQDILNQTSKYNIPIFMKNNLKGIWKEKLRQEFPE